MFIRLLLSHVFYIVVMKREKNRLTIVRKKCNLSRDIGVAVKMKYINFDFEGDLPNVAM